jgi:para-aminobenzoate synthetase component 1
VKSKILNYWVSVPYHQNEIRLNATEYCLLSNNELSKSDTIKTIHLKCSETKESYLNKVQQILNHIQRGDIYEINFCIEFYAQGAFINPYTLFEKIKTNIKAPFCEILKCKDEWILACSPELFLKKEGSTLITKPMKGTIRRSENAEEDEALKKKLFQDEKVRAENVMAVDVARNDLSRIAKSGSVVVSELFGIHTFPGVHQMVSTIQCELEKNITIEEILAATFPMASMTGAPKIRAMDLINKFESFNRNYYSGCAGKVFDNGDFELYVLIRSVFWNEKTGRLSIPVGGAITADSIPELEWEECLVKLNKLMKVLDKEIQFSIQ